MITGSDPSDHTFASSEQTTATTPYSPYFVAKHQACRNNSDKYLAFFLESAKNFLIFAMSIRTNDILETRNSKFNNLKFIRLWNRIKRTSRRIRS